MQRQIFKIEESSAKHLKTPYFMEVEYGDRMGNL
jgi:hypothetical protein